MRAIGTKNFQAVFAGVSYGDRPIKKAQTDEMKQKAAKLRQQVAADEAALEKFKKIAATNSSNPAPDLRPPVNAKLNTEVFAETTARFVRFTIHKSSASQPCIDELMVFDPDGTNVAPGAVPSSSGDLTGYPIHKLEHINDGKFGNSHSWIADKGTGWVQLDFKEPKQIAHDIIDGYASAKAARMIPNRLEAIDWALSQARAGDSVLIAGKGDSTRQLLGNKSLEFDDREIVRQWLYTTPSKHPATIPFSPTSFG